MKGQVFTKPCRDCGLEIWFDPDLHYFCDKDQSNRHQCKNWKPRPKDNYSLNNFELDALHDEIGDLRERINSTNANVSVVLQAVNELRYDIKNIIQSCPAV